MRRTSEHLFGCVFAALAAAGLAAPAGAQTTVAAAPETAAPTLTAVERWRADPATIFSGAEVDLDDFQWIARPVLVFANTPEDPAFRDQMQLLTARLDSLVERDVVLITDTDSRNPSEVRKKLRPRGFMLALIGKDGGIKLRKPLPWSVRELTRVIDKMPMRQREMDETVLGQ